MVRTESGVRARGDNPRSRGPAPDLLRVELRSTIETTTTPGGPPTAFHRSLVGGRPCQLVPFAGAGREVADLDVEAVAPHAAGGAATTTNRAGDGFARVFRRAALGQGVLLVLLLAAFGWGALHALSPGHGKAMVAAYLVGRRGTPRHAVALGAITTVTHTIGVFALGLVTLVATQYVVPERLYPWLNLSAGLLVLGVGAAALRSRVRWGRRQRAARAAAAGPPVGDAHEHPLAATPHEHHHHREGHAEAHGHAHAHEHHGHDHAHGHGHGDGHQPRDHTHGHHHHHLPPERITWRGLVGMGASAGLIPGATAASVGDGKRV